MTSHSASASIGDGRRSGRQPPWGIVVVVCLLAVHMVAGVLASSPGVGYDGAEYIRLGENLLAHGRFTYDGVNPVAGKPPGFPWLIAGYEKLTGGLDGFIYVQLLLLFSTYLIVATISRRFLGASWSLGLLGLLVLADPLRDLARLMLAEPLFLLLLSGGLLALVRMLETKRMMLCVVSGLLLGMSSYVRPVNFFWPLALLLLPFLFHGVRWRHVIAVAAISILATAPWLVRNERDFGRFVPMVANWGPLYYMTDSTLWEQHMLHGREAIINSQPFQEAMAGEFEFNWGPNERYRQMALRNLETDKGIYLWRCARQAFFVWSFIPGTKGARDDNPPLFFTGRILMLAFYVLVVLGAVRSWHEHSAAGLIMVLYAAYTAVLLFPVHTESRYLLPAYLLLLPLALAGFRHFSFRLRKRRLTAVNHLPRVHQHE